MQLDRGGSAFASPRVEPSSGLGQPSPDGLSRGGELRLRDPRTGADDGVVALDGPAEIADRAQALRKAHPAWRDLGVRGRAEILREWAATMRARSEELVGALVADTGRLHESRLEVDAVISGIERWADSAPELLQPAEPFTASYPAVTVEQALDPYPVVGVIGPWNFPLLLALIDAVPALAAGASVLVKPSEITPRFVPVLESITSVHPPLADAVSFVIGGADTGAAVVDVVDAVCFTGSVRTGRAVAVRAAQRLIPAYLELGGKDPAVVLASADLDLAAEAILWGGTANAGQSCLSIERVYVDRSVHDDFVQRLVARAERVPLAHPRPADGAIGPIIADRQAAVIEAHLADAVRRGATVRCGGRIERLNGGLYLRPTVLTDVDHQMLVMTEETFGPVLPVAPYATVDEAVRLANDTPYGLSAAVFGETNDARAVAARIRAGAVSVNDAALTAIVHDAEKNAYGVSGVGGTRMGRGALQRFVRTRAFLHKDPQVRDPWWYATDDSGETL